MTPRLIQRHRAEFIHGADKLHLFLPVQIYEREQLEPAESYQGSDHVLIFRSCRCLLLRVRAESIWSAPGDRLVQHFPVGRDNKDFKSFDRDAVTRLNDRPLARGGCAIAIEPLLVHWFDLVAASVKFAERNHL